MCVYEYVCVCERERESANVKTCICMEKKNYEEDSGHENIAGRTIHFKCESSFPYKFGRVI